MEIKQLSDTLYVCGQIQVSDIARLKDAGITAVICNRPDGEGEGQPSSQQLAQACDQVGLDWLYLPAVPGQLQQQQAEAFKQWRTHKAGPVLAFCRTGMRSTSLWALGEVAHSSVREVTESAQHIGYDLSGLAGQLADIQNA
ncbi:MAG: TIGR01244 family sulfur transferase [Pseudomonadales bacterium]